MSSNSNNKSRLNLWLVIGVGVLVVLLLLWLTIADLWGDTDVAAFISPCLNVVSFTSLL